MQTTLTAVIKAVQAVASREILPRYQKITHAVKADGSLLTEADVATQNALVEALQAIAPYPVLGEEMTPDEQYACWHAGQNGLWCVDPIDGTTNFVSGIPYFAISVALLREGKRVLGVVYNPITTECFSALAGGGAFCNGERLPIRQGVVSLAQAVAGVELKWLESPLARALAFDPPYASQRNFGASTLDWCYLAAGRLDVYLNGGQKLWDYAAGALILQESGGAMAGLACDIYDQAPLWQRGVVAARTPALLTDWLTWVRQHYPATIPALQTATSEPGLLTI